MKANEIIRQRRKELQLTLKEVAERAGVSEATVSRWESGSNPLLCAKKPRN